MSLTNLMRFANINMEKLLFFYILCLHMHRRLKMIFIVIYDPSGHLFQDITYWPVLVGPFDNRSKACEYLKVRSWNLYLDNEKYPNKEYEKKGLLAYLCEPGFPTSV